MLQNKDEVRTVFISYAREDIHLVLPIVHLLRAGGATVFVDLEGVAYGEKWMDIIFQQLRVSDRILVFWSLSAARSDWVKEEYLLAIGSGLRVVPVRLDNTPLPHELSKFQALTTLVPLVYDARRRLRPISWTILNIVAASAATLSLFLNLRQLAALSISEVLSATLNAVSVLAAVSAVVIQFSGRELSFPRRKPEELRRAIYEAVFVERAGTKSG